MMRSAEYNLPEEMVEEILFRLPSKFILRCKSVCKSWYSLITSKKFINNHLEFSSNRVKNNPFVDLILGWTCRKLPEDLNDFGYINNIDLQRHQMLTYATLNTKDNVISCVFQSFSLGRDRVFMHGSHCNGIICLVNLSEVTRERITFYNPSLLQSWTILARTIVDDGRFIYSAFGFGYDSRSDDYKYVRILTKGFSTECKAEVYSLGTNSWRAIKIEGAFQVFANGVYLKDVVYWIDHSYQSILSFDLYEEKFCHLPLLSQFWGKRILVWNQSLVLVHSLRHKKNFEMSILNTDGGRFTWTKHPTFEVPRNINLPLAFWKDNLLLVERNGDVLSYNINTKVITKLPLQLSLLGNTRYVDIFVESLVSVIPKGF